ncbi:psychosine receptor [Spea bombifrons]|uniref:psychosine receptor n=1 Tax=Spea bombifrons TaxID=233779 RepID=UPI00234BF876|nr:psychosine receptor [Spea bombifrons]
MNESAINCTIDHDLDMYMFPTIYIIVIAIGVPINCVSLYVSYQQVKKKNELGIYLFNLSFSDLLYTMTLTLWVDFSLHHDNWRFPDWVCSLSAFFMHTNLYSSAGFLTCISLDRYLAVVFPLKFSRLRTRRTALGISLIVWLIQSASKLIILVHKETFVVSRDVRCYYIFPMEKWKSTFSIINVCFGHFVPLTIMIFCYCKIYAAVKSNQATASGDKKKIKQLLFTIVVTFIITFTPYHVVLLMRSIWEPGNCLFAKKMFSPYKITLALSSLNCIADPLLYCFVSETGRADLKSIARCFTQYSEASAENAPPGKNKYAMCEISGRDNTEKGTDFILSKNDQTY